MIPPHITPSPARRLLSALLPLGITAGADLDDPARDATASIELDLLPSQSSAAAPPPQVPRLRRRTTASSSDSDASTGAEAEAYADVDFDSLDSEAPRLPWPAHVVGEASGHRASLDSNSSDRSWWSTSSASSSKSSRRARPRRQPIKSKRENEADAVWRDFWS